MKTQQFEIRIELYVGGESKSKQYYYYSDANKMNEAISNLLSIVHNDKNLYVEEKTDLSDRTILNIPSLSNDYHYFIVAKVKQVKFNESIKL